MAKTDSNFSGAMAGFIIVSILAISAFVYIYLNQTGFGFTIAGTRGYVESMISRGAIQVPGDAQDINIIVRRPQTVPCVCEKETFSVSTGQSKGFKPFSSYRPLPYGADPIQICQDYCIIEQKARYVCGGSDCAKSI